MAQNSICGTQNEALSTAYSSRIAVLSAAEGIPQTLAQIPLGVATIAGLDMAHDTTLHVLLF